MLKQRIIKVVFSLALVATLTGSAGIVADAFGLPLTPQAQACNNPSSSGGGC